jgi:hypothetical protein
LAMMSGKVPFLVWMGPVWQPVDLLFVVPLVPLCNPPCTHEACEDGALGKTMDEPIHTCRWW